MDGRFLFSWFTDGTGWTSARHNLEDLEKDGIDTLVNPTEYIESLLENNRILEYISN